jgi:hypothetical protein
LDSENESGSSGKLPDISVAKTKKAVPSVKNPVHGLVEGVKKGSAIYG